jgi:hypothetical protein
MAAAEPSQFALTVWPGGIVEPGSMWTQWPESRLLPGGWVDLDRGWSDSPSQPPPPEMYLRLARDVDLHDPDSLLQVVRDVGGMPLQHGFAGDFSSEKAYEVGWNRLAARRGLEVGDRPKNGMFHIAEVAWRLRVLDICGRVAVAYLSGDYVWPAWADQLISEGDGSPRSEFMKLSKPQRERRAWQEWHDLMTPALRRWHVRPVISGLVGGPLWEERPPTLLEVGALQIMNDLARQAEYHVCANETCGRLFARQVGDSEVFSRRTGVRFCSPSCRNAQQQREHRRRAKARKEGRSS